MDVVVRDETSTGDETARLLLAGLPSPVTVRELIRFRVREEVARYNAAPTARFVGLVRPADASTRHLDWERQAEVALEAFGRNGFFVFVGKRQYDDLDAEVPLRDADEVTFIRLVPLVGG